ncbi:MGMT family protein, partial [bacterium]|nr:MGMT family protein [bacterium]
MTSQVRFQQPAPREDKFTQSARRGCPHEKHALIYDVVRQIPCGRVATYGQVALWADLPGHARLAGYALYNLPRELAGEVPWQRVVNAQGRISYSESRHGNDHLQRELLEAEGVI